MISACLPGRVASLPWWKYSRTWRSPLELDEPLGDDDVDEQLRVAERELLQARATYTVRRKAIEAVLMSDPTLKAVHLKAITRANQ
jgi:hypothetical protein